MPAGAVMQPDLSHVTLVAVSSIALDATARALALSIDQGRFARAVLFADRAPPAGLPEGVVWHKIAPVTSRALYSRFLFHELARHITTSHVLVVQWDGYILDHAAWDPAFLDYDYIGAAWSHFGDSFIVGNGGFSLRSRRLLDALAHYRLYPGEAEDTAICRRLRPLLEQHHAIRFAPPEVSARFAFERVPRQGRPFGFHGVFNMIDLMTPRALLDLLSGLEPATVHANERAEIVLGLVRRGEFATAVRLLARFLWPAYPRQTRRSAL